MHSCAKVGERGRTPLLRTGTAKPGTKKSFRYARFGSDAAIGKVVVMGDGKNRTEACKRTAALGRVVVGCCLSGTICRNTSDLLIPPALPYTSTVCTVYMLMYRTMSLHVKESVQQTSQSMSGTEQIRPNFNRANLMQIHVFLTKTKFCRSTPLVSWKKQTLVGTSIFLLSIFKRVVLEKSMFGQWHWLKPSQQTENEMSTSAS